MHEFRHCLQSALEKLRSQRLLRIGRPLRRRHIARYAPQANGIPGEIDEPLVLADHFAEWTRDKSRTWRRGCACRQPKADPVFEAMQPRPLRPQTELFIDGE